MKKCRICRKEIEITQNKYCSKICYEKSLKNICLNCGEKCEISQKYCNKKCRDDFKANRLNCKTCGKEFIVRDKWRLRSHEVKYCSSECNLRKWGINSNYFDNLTPEKIVTLGQLITTCHIVDYNTIIIQSNETTMLDISNKLESTYKSVTAQLGLVRQKITSHKLVLRLSELGFQKTYLYQDVPLLDGDLMSLSESSEFNSLSKSSDLIWEGLKQTHSYYQDDEGINVFKTERSRVALWVCDRFGGKSITNTYKDVYRGVMGCEWVVVWK